MEQTSIYENTAQKKCDSDRDDEMGIPDDLKIVNRCNRKYDDNFSDCMFLSCHVCVSE